MVSWQMKAIKAEVRVHLGKAGDRAVQRPRGTMVSGWVRVWD